MPSQYVTLKHSDAEFQNYLWGHNETDLRAVPVKTYNVGTPEECVTFELTPIAEIKKPGFLIYVSSLIKLKSFILILLPLYYVLNRNYLNHDLLDPLGAMLAAFAMILLFAGLNIRNDMNDHVSGYDRVNLDAAKKPIRLGWITAKQSSRCSLVLIFAAAVLALPVVLLHLQLLKVLAFSLSLFFLGQFSKRNSYKHQHFGELVLFMLAGPTLVAGYQISMGAAVDTEVLAFGGLWGLVVLYLVQVNNFSHIMTSSQSGIKNSMTKLGFDFSQKFLMLEWALILALWAAFHAFFGTVLWSLAGAVGLAVFSAPLFRELSHIKSPMGSSLQSIRKRANKVFLIMVLLFVLENMGMLWAS